MLRSIYYNCAGLEMFIYADACERNKVKGRWLQIASYE